MIKAEMTTYYEAKTAVKVEQRLSDEFEVKVGASERDGGEEEVAY